MQELLQQNWVPQPAEDGSEAAAPPHAFDPASVEYTVRHYTFKPVVHHAAQAATRVLCARIVALFPKTVCAHICPDPVAYAHIFSYTIARCRCCQGAWQRRRRCRT